MRALSRKGLIAKIDRAFSRYIRQRDAVGGWVDCVTCGLRMPWEESQAGHFVKRGHMAARWHEQNVAPQCPRCNLYLGGAQDEFAAYIVRTHGQDTLEELLRLKHSTRRYTMAELRDLVEQYKG